MLAEMCGKVVYVNLKNKSIFPLYAKNANRNFNCKYVIYELPICIFSKNIISSTNYILYIDKPKSLTNYIHYIRYIHTHLLEIKEEKNR